MDVIRPDPNISNEWKSEKGQNRRNRKNQVKEDGSEEMTPDETRQVRGQMELSNVSRSQIGAEETVGHLIWNQNPPAQLQNNQHRFPRPDRIHPRNAGPMFEPEYNNYPLSSSPPYIRDEESPSDPSPPPPPRKVKGRPNQPPLALSTPKPKFGFSTSAILIIIQVLIIFLFAVFVSYDMEVTANPKMEPKNQGSSGQDKENRENGGYLKFYSANNLRLHKFYPFFQDVHVMIFVGFGFLMTFLRKYGYSAVGYNMLIAAIAIQWSILCRGIFHHGLNTIPINIESLINGDFAAGAVLISFGALLGVTNPLHLVTLCLIEVFLYALNEYIGATLFGAIDIGGSMWIHTFGAYFGLALSLTMRRQKDIDTKNEGSSYNSDIFAMIGTIFLWLFWPSFNGAMATGDDQHRAVINTVLSLTGSCIFSFAASSLMCPENKFSMVHVQNASLAGGVAVGAIADLMIQPFGALLIGSLAGLLSTAGYVYISPFLQRKIGLHDTCGVHNLHGMPGVMAGFIGVIMAAIATEDQYGNSLYQQYPARAPPENSSLLRDIRDEMLSIEPGQGRTGQEQALYQLAALFTTIGIAVVGGAVTGVVLRIPFFGKVPNEFLFDDSNLWEVPENEEKDQTNVDGLTHRNGTGGNTATAGIEMSQGKRD